MPIASSASSRSRRRPDRAADRGPPLAASLPRLQARRRLGISRSDSHGSTLTPRYSPLRLATTLGRFRCQRSCGTRCFNHLRPQPDPRSWKRRATPSPPPCFRSWTGSARLFTTTLQEAFTHHWRSPTRSGRPDRRSARTPPRRCGASTWTPVPHRRAGAAEGAAQQAREDVGQGRRQVVEFLHREADRFPLSAVPSAR